MGNEQSESGAKERPSSSSYSGQQQKNQKKPTNNAEDTDSESNSPSGASANAGTGSYRSGESEETLADALKLTNYQMQMLAHSWPRVQQTGGHAIGGSLFRKMASKCPQCRQAFQKMTIIEGFSPRGGRSVDVYKEHGRILFDLFNEAIKNLNEPLSGIVAVCRDYGAKHASLTADGFQNRIWDDLSEILVEHIIKTDAVRKHRELSKAWTALIAFLIEKIKEGYKNNFRKPSNNPSPSNPHQHQQQQQQAGRSGGHSLTVSGVGESQWSHPANEGSGQSPQQSPEVEKREHQYSRSNYEEVSVEENEQND